MDSGRLDPNIWLMATQIADIKFDKHSARKMQYRTNVYKKLGGRYSEEKTPAQKSLSKWTDEKWTTKSGLKSADTGERYLPQKVISGLSDKDYQRTSKIKKAGTTQYVKQPKDIVAKIKKIKKTLYG